MIEFDIIDELGDNAELLTKSDLWLSTIEVKLAQDLTILLHDLEQIQTAIKIKRRLQQNNNVAVKRQIRNNTIPDEIIEILPLSKAMRAVSQGGLQDQVGIWAADGYDVQSVQTA